MYLRAVSVILLSTLVLCGQEETKPSNAPPLSNAAKSASAEIAQFTVQPGTKVPLSMINSVSTKNASEGDRVYLESVFPILSNGRVVIPPGSYVAGTITEVKRPGRVKGRGEIYLRFDSLTLPNGVTRDFRARVGSLDGRASEELDKSEGKIKSEGNKSGDLKTIGEAAGAGAGIGGLAGVSSGHTGLGAGIGAAAGAAAGLIGVLATRGPEAVLAKGTTVEMVLDRTLTFDAAELDFTHSMGRAGVSDGPGPLPSQKDSSVPRRRFP
jgi:type IV secretion system protein VirB10